MPIEASSVTGKHAITRPPGTRRVLRRRDRGEIGFQTRESEYLVRELIPDCKIRHSSRDTAQSAPA